MITIRPFITKVPDWLRHTVFFALGLVATIAVTALIARKAKQKLREAGLDQEVGEPTP